MFGLFKNQYMVEVYGKLPFYKDYINIIASTETSLWQEWLLNVFGQKNTLIPQGIWHFLFFPAKDAHLVTGLIMQGSDGLRNFPFSLFVSLGRQAIKNQLKWAELFAIRDHLIEIYKTVYTASDIDGFYRTLSGTSVETNRKNIKSGYLKSVRLPDLTPLIRGQDSEFPVFSILEKSGLSCLSKGSLSGKEIISNWERHPPYADMQLNMVSNEHIKF
jgi:hypothetical protein